MEDRFRLKGWLVEERRMVKIEAISFSLNIAWVAPKKLGLPIGEKIILRQCTGVRDRDNTLIYEGDLLQHPDHKDILTVVYDDTVFWVETQNGDIEMLGLVYSKSKVIGYSIPAEETPQQTCETCDWVRELFGNVVCEPINCYETVKTTLDTPACENYISSG